MARHGMRAALALIAGLGTFLVLGYGKQDVGDEFIYGLIVGAIVWAVAGWALTAAPGKDHR